MPITRSETTRTWSVNEAYGSRQTAAWLIATVQRWLHVRVVQNAWYIGARQPAKQRKRREEASPRPPQHKLRDILQEHRLLKNFAVSSIRIRRYTALPHKHVEDAIQISETVFPAFWCPWRETLLRIWAVSALKNTYNRKYLALVTLRFLDGKSEKLYQPKQLAVYVQKRYRSFLGA